MNEFKIKKLKAKNFLCFGENGIEVDFESKGNIILLQGRNLDNISEDEEEKLCSNGVGKSSIGDAIVFALTGKTIRKFKKIEQVINNTAGKGLVVELWVDNFKIVRTRSSTSSLKIFDLSKKDSNGDPLDLTKGINDTQAYIAKELGFNAESQSLINLLVLTDNNKGSFLESDTPEKRKMVENYLQLEQYAEYSKSASEALKEQKSNIKDFQKELERAEIYLEDAKSRLISDESLEENWKKNKKFELNALISKFKSKQEELGKSDNGKALLEYEEAQTKIVEINSKIKELQTELEPFPSFIDLLKKDLEKNNVQKNELSLKIQKIKSDCITSKSLITQNNSIVNDLNSQKCKSCGFFDEETSKKAAKIVEEETIKLNELTKQYESISKELNDQTALVSTIEQSFKLNNDKFNALNNNLDSLRVNLTSLSKIEKPEKTSDEKVIEEQMSELKNQILLKKEEYEGKSPYVEILEKDKADILKNEKNLENKKKELDKVSELIPYYEFWVKAFGEKGIRKFVIDGIIPPLNNRIHYWLNYLIDNKIKLEFDSELNERIERNPSDGDEFVYSAMSGGEKRRLNLAVSQAFSYITTLATGSCPSIIFLDEVATNIDQVGINNVYNMIKELSKERQVLVTTHDKGLLELLNGADVINLEKHNGITRIV